MKSTIYLMDLRKKKWTKILSDAPHKLGHAIGYTKLIADHGNWIKYIWGDKLNNDERAIQAHRNSYKTTAIDIVGAMWKLLFNPQYTILLVREETSNAIAIVLEITDKYKHQNMVALYNELYGIDTFTLKRESQKSIVLPTKQEMTREGNIDAAGLGTSLTGRHYMHIHTDDIVTLKDRVSKAKRAKTLHTIRELRNLMDLETGILSHTGTPWHRDDAWNHIPNILKFPLGAVNIPAITKDVDAATRHFREGTTNSLFSANYLLKHVASDDSLFKDAKWLESIPQNYQPRAHIDAGYKGKNTTALTLLEYEKDRDRFIATGFVWDKNIIDNFGDIGRRINDPRWKTGTLLIEDNADKGFSAKEIRNYHPVVNEYHESMNKHVKIISYVLKNWYKIYWTPATDPEYINQILDYIEGDEPDDAPDSLASLLREFDTAAGIETDEIAGGGDLDYILSDDRIR